MSQADLPQTIKDVKSGVLRIKFEDTTGEFLTSGTGFLFKGYLITNNHVFFSPEEGEMPNNSTITLETGDGQTLLVEDDKNFREARIETGSDKNNKDYFVFDLSDLKIDQKKQLELGTHNDVQIGTQVLILGFPFKLEHFTAHVGYVSSKYVNKQGINMIQLDASTNNGNSGGPVILPEKEKVVGIMTRKESGLEKQFDNLMLSFEQSIEVLENAKGSAFLSGVDPLQALESSQEQMKIIANNLKRSANTGIGYAFSCEPLMNENFYVED